jgi:hypothetical protein
VRRSLLALVLLVSGAASAGEPVDTLQLDGELFINSEIPWIGGSLHYEHRFADSPAGLTLRGSVTPGDAIDSEGDGSFVRYAALAGVRGHADRFYGEASLGWLGLRTPATHDVEFGNSGVRWASVVELDLQLGCRIGPVDAGLFVPVFLDQPFLPGIGLRIGAAFDL